jgi:hypothetical protein
MANASPARPTAPVSLAVMTAAAAHVVVASPARHVTTANVPVDAHPTAPASRVVVMVVVVRVAAALQVRRAMPASVLMNHAAHHSVLLCKTYWRSSVLPRAANVSILS